MAIKQKQNNLFDDYMERRFAAMAWAEAQNDSGDRQPVTVRLPISLVRKIDFLAKSLDHSRQVFLDDLIGIAVAQALSAYIGAHAEGEHRDRAKAEVAELYQSANREENEALFGALEEAK
ncbi:hypothetical protein [Pseudomonas aeruginosa]|uniref:hypothetical protein n=1 Tax=Pseudomonas aeruginosa TaxID=287 RepID=UPI003D2BB6E2